MKLSTPCSICTKPLVLVTSLPLQTCSLDSYKCGHLFAAPLLASTNGHAVRELNFTSIDGAKTAREYQKIGVEFILDSDFNAILADQQRLGKTPQTLLALKNAYTERTPCLILVRSANIWQWIREYKTWTDPLPNGIWLITGTKGWIPGGFSSYIISMDTFSREGMVERLLSFGFKLVIVDEAHSFKNTESNRSQALIQFIKEISNRNISIELKFTCINCQHAWVESKEQELNLWKDAGSSRLSVRHYTSCPLCATPVSHATVLKRSGAEEIEDKKCGVVLLTGTPIKNSADEYFVPLNIVAPTRFSSLDSFRRQWLEQDSKGKWKRVHHYRMDEFKTLIKPFVLRREKEDVYDSLPELNRIFTVIQPDRDKLVNAYNKILQGMETKLSERSNPTYWDMVDDLMALRRICGLMKVPWTIDYLRNALEDSENQRYAVGLHHKDVRDVLSYQLQGKCLSLTGADNSERKDYVMRSFEHSSERILLINMLAGGVGMDFHYCNNILILERQWSSADEEQFEYRFYNPDKSIKTAPTTVEYLIIKGSIEQFFYDMIEEKRKIFGETISNNWSLSSEPASFKDLMDQTVSSRL